MGALGAHLEVQQRTTALESLLDILRKVLRAMILPLQTSFTYIAAVPKKDPTEKRAVGVLTTLLRVLGRLLYPSYQEHDFLPGT